MSVREYAGATVRFLHGATLADFTLELGYVDLTGTEAKLIRDHYRTQMGGFIPFILSLEAWAGHSSDTDIFPVATQWRYAGPPEEVQKDGGLVDIAVKLSSTLV